MNRDYPTAEEDYAQILNEIAGHFDLDVELLQKLIDYEQGRVHLAKRRGAKDDIRKMIEDWIESQQT